MFSTILIFPLFVLYPPSSSSPPAHLPLIILNPSFSSLLLWGCNENALSIFTKVRNLANFVLPKIFYGERPNFRENRKTFGGLPSAAFL